MVEHQPKVDEETAQHLYCTLQQLRIGDRVNFGGGLPPQRVKDVFVHDDFLGIEFEVTNPVDQEQNDTIEIIPDGIDIKKPSDHYSSSPGAVITAWSNVFESIGVITDATVTRTPSDSGGELVHADITWRVQLKPFSSELEHVTNFNG